MIKPVSFGSVYRAYMTQKNIDNGKCSDCVLEKELIDKGITYEHSLINKNEFGAPVNLNKLPVYISSIDDYGVSRYTFAVPDSSDIDTETLMANRGIKFEKRNTADLISDLGIMMRIARPENGFRLVSVDSEKLEEFIKNQDSNFDHCKKDYERCFKDRTDFIIKTADEFDAPTVYIKYKSDNGTPESLKRYVNTFGADKLNPDSVSVWMEQRGDNSDINTYYGMKGAGLVDIPVYLDDESYINAKILGLI